MQEVHVIHTFHKNPDEEVRLSLKQFKDRRYLDLRLWYQPSSGGEYLPTKKGLTLSVEFLPELKRGIERAGKASAEWALQGTSKSVQ